MNRWINIFFLMAIAFIASSCSSSKERMDLDHYHTVTIGTQESFLEAAFGKPDEVIDNGPSQKIWVYIEKIHMGRRVVEQRKYYFVLAKEKVVGKYLRYESTPSYQPYYERGSVFPNEY